MGDATGHGRAISVSESLTPPLEFLVQFEAPNIDSSKLFLKTIYFLSSTSTQVAVSLSVFLPDRIVGSAGHSAEALCQLPPYQWGRRRHRA